MLMYFRRKRARKMYLKVLPILLRKQFGKRKKYTAEQILSVVKRYSLNEDYLYYGFVMFMSRETYEASMEMLTIQKPYMDVRNELASKYFKDNARFTIHDIYDYAYKRRRVGQRYSGIEGYYRVIFGGNFRNR